MGDNLSHRVAKLYLSTIEDAGQDVLLTFLSKVRALATLQQNAHWTVKGDPSYGDHLLFGRLYETTSAEVDVIAEKVVGYFGPSAVCPMDQTLRVAAHVRSIAEGTTCPIRRVWHAEHELQSFLKNTYTALKEAQIMSLGLDDFIMALASTHETHLFLLRQRLAK